MVSALVVRAACVRFRVMCGARVVSVRVAGGSASDRRATPRGGTSVSRVRGVPSVRDTMCDV